MFMGSAKQLKKAKITLSKGNSAHGSNNNIQTAQYINLNGGTTKHAHHARQGNSLEGIKKNS